MLKTPPKKHEKFTDSEVSKRGVRKMQTPQSEISDENISKRNGKAKDEL
jgi:hypothetical protein